MGKHVWAVAILAGLIAAGGAFVAGRATAPGSGSAGPDSGYANGFQVGRAVGVQEGRALQVGPSMGDAFTSGYVAGINDAFGGYDGGWSLAAPYLVTLGPGTGGATYRIASRLDLRAGVSYYLCPDGSGICQEPR